MGAPAADYDEAFEALYAVAYRVAYRLLGHRQAAQDVAQETLARAFVHWPAVAGYDDPSGWVARVGANLAVADWRRGKRRPPEPSNHDGGHDAADRRVDLHRALARLPRRQREVLFLRYLADLPEATVARALGCSAGAVKQHANRAMAALRATLGDGEVSPDVRAV